MTSAMRSWRIQNPAVEISFILIRTMAEKIHGDGGDNTGSHVRPPLSLISAVRASDCPCRGRGQGKITCREPAQATQRSDEARSDSSKACRPILAEPLQVNGGHGFSMTDMLPW